MLAPLVLVLALSPGDADLERGRAIYLQNCARCHGPEGRGDTELVLAPPPRNFRAGRFSFGNTPEALFNTVSTGIPGTAMLAFDETLSESDRRLVVAYVRTLIPLGESLTERETAMLVGPTPRVVRGYLPPLPGETLPIARGLMIGMPGGFSFAYRTDDARLMAVQRGAFVDRRDWLGRGGTALKLLGDRFYALQDGNPPPPFARANGAELLPLKGCFAGSWVQGGSAGIDYDLVDLSRQRVASVREWNTVEHSVGALGFTRHLELRAARAADLAFDAASPAAGGSWVHGYPEQFTQRGAYQLAPLLPGQWLVYQRDGACEYYRLEFPAGAQLVRSGAALTIWFAAPPAPIEVKASILIAPGWSTELLEALKDEVGR